MKDLKPIEDTSYCDDYLRPLAVFDVALGVIIGFMLALLVLK